MYRMMKSRGALEDEYVARLSRLEALVGRGLSAAVYTQLTDVEIEVNGLLTYYRAVEKLDARRIAEIHRRLICLGSGP